MLKTALLAVSALVLAVLFQSNGGFKSLTNGDKADARADRAFAKANCHKLSNAQSSIYKTAAGFDLHIPKWVDLQPSTAQFNKRCELLSIHLHFLISDGLISPKAHYKSGHQNYEKKYNTVDRFTTMISFKRVEDDTGRSFELCKNKDLSIAYPEYHLEICPSLKMSGNNPAYTMSHFPVFFFKDAKGYLASLTCSPRQLEAYSLDNIVDLDVRSPCRGYWRWRDGAYIMFDISKGEILKKTYSSIKQTETIINSWLVTKPVIELNKAVYLRL